MMKEIENAIVEEGKIIDPISEKVLGVVGRVILAVEMPPEMLGIYRIESVIVYDVDETLEFNDQEKVDNQGISCRGIRNTSRMHRNNIKGE